jgi:hypothetical protein
MKLGNKFYFAFLLIFANLLFSCSSSPKTDGNVDELVKERLLQREREKEEIENNKRLRDSISQMETFSRLSKSPANFVLRYVCPLSCWISNYTFYADNTVIVEFGERHWLFGEWSLDNDNLIILFDRAEGERGIGKPNNEPIGGVASHYIYTYDEYVPFVEEIDVYKEEYNWAEAVQNIIQKGSIGDCIGFNNYSLLKNGAKAKRVFLLGKYTFASEKELTSEMLENYDKEQLRIIRNEIFARYGYIFNDKTLEKYFRQQSWYSPTRRNVDKYLSEREQKNIVLLLEIENERN